jgi:TolA-binding protein
MKFVLIVAALISALLMGFRKVLNNGQFLAYLDTHPNPKVVPPVSYVVGEGYYFMRSLQNAATYYLRIAERYPDSDYAEDAYYKYLVALDEANTPRPAMADYYGTYLERYPQGKYTEIIQKRIEYCRNSR